MVFLWHGYHLVFPENVSDHLYQFSTFSGFSNSKRSTLSLIWLSCVRVIWLERNARIFHQKEASFNQLLDKVNLRSYWWLKANHPSFIFPTIHCGWTLYLAWEYLCNRVVFCSCFGCFDILIIDSFSWDFGTPYIEIFRFSVF